MKFRFHRGGFDESMATCCEVNSLNQLIDIIEASMGIKVDQIKFSLPVYDERNGWDTHFVKARFSVRDGFLIVGYSDSDDFGNTHQTGAAP